MSMKFCETSKLKMYKKVVQTLVQRSGSPAALEVVVEASDGERSGSGTEAAKKVESAGAEACRVRPEGLQRPLAPATRGSGRLQTATVVSLQVGGSPIAGGKQRAQL